MSKKINKKKKKKRIRNEDKRPSVDTLFAGQDQKHEVI
jgi:hypothetical protein